MNGIEASAIGFILLAIAHSSLGELRMLPTITKGWSKSEPPTATLIRIVQSAWHATSLAWVGIALLLLQVQPIVAVCIAAGLPGIYLMIRLPNHPAWAVMLFVSFATALAGGYIPSLALVASAHLTAFILLVAALIHFYWAFGGKLGVQSAIPISAESNNPVFTPSKIATGTVALLLSGFSIAIELLIAGLVFNGLWWSVFAGALALMLRGIGDRKYVGLTKTIHDTAFAEKDSRYFTPTIILLSFGVCAALLVSR